MYKELFELYGELDKAAKKAGYVSPLVFGEGTIGATLMLIGEAPGANEEAQRKPFVGKAGQNLNELLQEVKIDRAQSFVSNLVKIRPSAVSAKGNIINRTPNADEKEFFKPYLLREIDIVAPKIIVTLGNTPLSVFLNSTIGTVHGKLFTDKKYRVFPMYHPASLIYNRALLDTYKKDMQSLANIVQNIKRVD